MKAVCWHGKGDIRVERVPDPTLLSPRDAIVRVTSTTICGTDLHHYDGFMAGMQPGDVVGHECMGLVVEVGPKVTSLRVGDRVVVSALIACGQCYYCRHDLWSQCDNTNPNAAAVEKLYGYSPGGIFGLSHLFGGYAGGQAEYVRVPFADHTTLVVGDDLPDEKVLFLSDVFPTGYMAAEHCNIKPGDTVAVWGCGPVGQFAIQSARLLGAERVIAIDRFPERLDLARNAAGAETINYAETDVLTALDDKTSGRGPDACVDAVGMEAHGASALLGAYDRIKTALMLETDRPYALRQAIQACRKWGTVSVAGHYAGFVDSFPLGTLFAKGLTLKTGPTPMQRYMKPLLEHIRKGSIDPSFVVSHEMKLDDAARAYRMFRDKQDDCLKVVLRP